MDAVDYANAACYEVGMRRLVKLQLEVDVAYEGDLDELVDVVIARAEAAVRAEGGDPIGSSGQWRGIDPEIDGEGSQ